MVSLTNKAVELRRADSGLSSSALVLFFLFFLITTLLSDFPIASLASLIGFLLFGVYTCIAAPSFLIKYFSVLFGIVAAIAGCFSCEFLGGYLPELRKTVFYSGSLPLLILNYFIFLSCLHRFDGAFGADDKKLLTEVPVRKEWKWFKWLHASVLLMIVMMFLHALPNPSFIHGVDRFSYSSQYLSGIWRYLHSASMILCIIPLIAVRFGYRKSGWLAIFVFCLYLFWTGIKFSGFYSLLSLATFVYYDKVVTFSRKFIYKLLIGAFVVLGLLLGLSVFAHSFAASSDTASEFFFNRTAQQGQLWWSTYSTYSPCDGIDEFSDELNGLAIGEKSISECRGDRYGIYKMMYLNAPTDLVDSKLSSGSRYTEAAYPSMYYYFGPFGTVGFSVLTAFGTVCLVNLMIKVIHGREVFSSLACFIIWRAWAVFRSMLLLSPFFDLSVLLSITILILFSRGLYGTSIASSDSKVNDCLISGGVNDKR